MKEGVFLTRYGSRGFAGGDDKTEAIRLDIWVDRRAATKTPVTEISRHGLAMTTTAPTAAAMPISFNGLARAYFSTIGCTTSTARQAGCERHHADVVRRTERQRPFNPDEWDRFERDAPAEDA